MSAKISWMGCGFTVVLRFAVARRPTGRLGALHQVRPAYPPKKGATLAIGIHKTTLRNCKPLHPFAVRYKQELNAPCRSVSLTPRSPRARTRVMAHQASWLSNFRRQKAGKEAVGEKRPLPDPGSVTVPFGKTPRALTRRFLRFFYEPVEAFVLHAVRPSGLMGRSIASISLLE